MPKICCTCKLSKNLTEFRKDKSKVDGYRHECKECSKLYHKAKYTEQYGEKAKLRARETHAKLREHLLQYRLEHPCICCGEDEPACLDFHHLDPNEKDFQIAGSQQRSWTKILAEIEKCVVLCSNCHRKVHADLICLL